tara:strand:- start:1969 stop:2310 length:342 start_codon:yes stop_codon:yes gene_type:complete
MTNYEWNCKTVEVRPLEDGQTDVVYNVNWIVIATSDVLDPDGKAYTSKVLGEQTVTYNPDNPFIPFSDLTNEIVTNWTQSAMGSEQVSSIESYAESLINDLISPTSVTLTIEN